MYIIVKIEMDHCEPILENCEIVGYTTKKDEAVTFETQSNLQTKRDALHHIAYRVLELDDDIVNVVRNTGFYARLKDI